MDAADFGSHFETQLGVEVRQRLIHQHQRRFDDDGARDGDALLLAAGELRWEGGGFVGQADAVEPLAGGPGRALRAGDLGADG